MIFLYCSILSIYSQEHSHIHILIKLHQLNIGQYWQVLGKIIERMLGIYFITQYDVTNFPCWIKRLAMLPQRKTMWKKVAKRMWKSQR